MLPLVMLALLCGCGDRSTNDIHDYTKFKSFAACRDYYAKISPGVLPQFDVPEVNYPQLADTKCAEFNKLLLDRTGRTDDRFVVAYAIPKFVCVDPKLFFSDCSSTTDDELESCGIEHQISFFNLATSLGTQALPQISQERREDAVERLQKLEKRFPPSLCTEEQTGITSLFKE